MEAISELWGRGAWQAWHQSLWSSGIGSETVLYGRMPYVPEEMPGFTGSMWPGRMADPLFIGGPVRSAPGRARDRGALSVRESGYWPDIMILQVRFRSLWNSGTGNATVRFDRLPSLRAAENTSGGAIVFLRSGGRVYISGGQHLLPGSEAEAAPSVMASRFCRASMIWLPPTLNC